MEEFVFVVPCLLGLEGIISHELRRLSLEPRAENGRVLFSGTLEDAARVNINMRCGERVLLCLAEFTAKTFDELFEGVKAAPWEEIIPFDGQFPVKGYCLNSQLMSVSDCQAIIKKAMADRLGGKYGCTRMPENGVRYQIQFSLMKDRASIMLDTTGAGLHKRGYRAVSGGAPIKETLAAAMIDIARWNSSVPFLDPMCGSGTIAIEAALYGKRRAPGVNRGFAMEGWERVREGMFTELRDEARAGERHDKFTVYASDIDPQMAELTRRNALLAGVDDVVCVSTADAADVKSDDEGGIMFANPPYGERLLDIKEAQELCAVLGHVWSGLRGWGACVITPDESFERFFGRKADKKRKLYNGMIKCDLYQYFRQKKPR